MNNRILATIVIYKQRWADLPAQPFLERAVLGGCCDLLIYDNSPEPQWVTFFEEEGVTYIHDPQNSGLAVAYDRGLEAAKDFEWLLLLDQDTAVTAKYLQQLQVLEPIATLAAVVPQIFSHDKQISPVLAENYIDREAVALEPGYYQRRLMAINSGSALNVSYLKEIGGFNHEFPLDFLDHWLFWRIFQDNKVIFVMDQQLKHDLSVLNYGTLNVDRYRSILEAEKTFYTKYDIEHLSAHKQQLWLRVAKQFLTVKNRDFWKVTLKEARKEKQS